MLVGIHTNPYGEISPLSEKFVKILVYNNIDCRIMHSDDHDFWETIPQLDLFIYMWEHTDVYRYHGRTILPIIENYYGIKCLPDQNTCWHYDDKIKQYLMLESKRFPVVESWFFTNKNNTINWLKSGIEYPLVFKLAGGAGSSNVVLLRTKRKAVSMAKKMFGNGIMPGKVPSITNIHRKYSTPSEFIKRKLKPYYNKYIRKIDPYVNWVPHKNYFYCQRFYPNNSYDTRVTTIGNRAFAFRRFVRKNDFRASGSDNWSIDRSHIDMRMVEIAKEISRTFNFQVMAYDFIYDENKNPVIVEISYTYGDFPEFSTGYINDDLQWINGNYWTQYLELIDALNMPNLMQPYMKPTGHYASVLKNGK